MSRVVTASETHAFSRPANVDERVAGTCTNYVEKDIRLLNYIGFRLTKMCGILWRQCEEGI
ncbi:hypothetical protein Psch_01520 [Pelotomaculum schinkii]|uniref:Uncharacterized protein n=1 Tax=Pelotomaculum schinkii TaxID=78350 RepID=A0A4Y7RG21_9FIRM|nr:hypothetical protein Psch_01520 [Pelotomaculum schinkii]